MNHQPPAGAMDEPNGSCFRQRLGGARAGRDARERAPRTVREDDGLELDLGRRLVAVLAREHVDLALVHAELADVGLQMGRAVRVRCGLYALWFFPSALAREELAPRIRNIEPGAGSRACEQIDRTLNVRPYAALSVMENPEWVRRAKASDALAVPVKHCHRLVEVCAGRARARAKAAPARRTFKWKMSAHCIAG